MPKFDPAVSLGPWKGASSSGPVLSYLQASKLSQPLKIHPLLACVTWDPKPYAKYLAWNIVELPEFASIWIDYDATETDSSRSAFTLRQVHGSRSCTYYIVGQDGQYAWPTDWVSHVLTAIFDFFASPLYVDELGEMHPRAVRIMEQQYFEKRAQGFQDGFIGYRKSDALLAQTYFNGIRYDPDMTQSKLNFRGSNVLVLSLGNC